jgi:sulfotransferase
MQRIIPVSGLPRSGSTLWMQIVGQNPKFHSTPTSGLINFWMNAKRNWKDNNEFRSQGLDEVENRLKGSFKGIIDGFYEEELAQGKYVFEKSRGWIAYIDYLKDIYQNPDLKVIVLVRDIKAIIASFEKLYRKRSISYPEFSDDDFILSQTVEGRAEILLRKNGVVGLTI